MISPDRALQMVLEVVEPLAAKPVSVSSAIGLILAEQVQADRDYPPFDRAMMDGYAVGRMGGETSPVARVVGQIAAGQVHSTQLKPGECVEIMTGAQCPLGTQSVVPVEQAVRDGKLVKLPTTIAPWQHMARRASECHQHSVVLQSGDRVTPLAAGVLASVGRCEVLVVPLPTIGTITTGDELVADNSLAESPQIRDSNGPMIAAMASTRGILPAQMLHVDDDCGAIVAALTAMSDRDIVILTGGVSAGRYDLVPDAVRQAGGDVVFHKVRQKPGKPMLVAKRGGQILFGLPGNPLAAHFCFHRYVSAAIRRLGGHSAPVAPSSFGILGEPVRANESRPWFVLGRAIPDGSGATHWKLQPLPGKSSADLFGTSHANCYIVVQPGDGMRKAGESMTFEWLAEARSEHS